MNIFPGSLGTSSPPWRVGIRIAAWLEEIAWSGGTGEVKACMGEVYGGGTGEGILRVGGEDNAFALDPASMGSVLDIFY